MGDEGGSTRMKIVWINCLNGDNVAENWRSLYVVEITLYSMLSWTSSQCKDCKIWSELEELWAAIWRHRQGVLGALVPSYLGFGKGVYPTRNCSTQSWVYKWCTDSVSCTEAKKWSDVAKIADVVKLYTGDSQDLMRKNVWNSKMKPRLPTRVRLYRIVLRNCLKLSEPHAGSLSSSGSEFQTVGPAIEKAQRPYVLRRQRGTMSWWRFAERRRSRDATLEDVVKWSAR